MDNRQYFKDKIIPAVMEHLVCSSGSEVLSVQLSRLSMFNWSFIAVFDIELKSGIVKKYLKIPKKLGKCPIVDCIKDPSLINTARNEYRTLLKLHDFFARSSGVSVVKPVGYIESCNAVLMDGIMGEKLFKLIREKRISQDKACSIMKDIGTAMALYHNRCIGLRTEKLDYQKMFSAFKYAGGLFKDQVDAAIRSDVAEDIPYSNMLLGFEMRNIFYSEKDDTITIHDLIELEHRPIFDDISQFLVSIDLIHWGSVFCKRPPKDYSISFLRGYFGEGGYSEKTVHSFFIKEYLRFYENVMDSLSKERHSKFIRKVLNKMYVLRNIKKALSDSTFS